MNRLELEYVPVGSLRTYHRNPRQGNVTAIRASLLVNGQYRPIVVNRGTYTGRERETLAGNHTLLAHRDLIENPDPADENPERWSQIAVAWVDVDDDQAARIVAVDNRSADLGDYDTRLLAELLGDLPDLDGTGYDPGDLAELERAIAEPEFEPEDDVERLDQRAMTRCPECGHVFAPSTFKKWRLDAEQAADAG